MAIYSPFGTKVEIIGRISDAEVLCEYVDHDSPPREFFVSALKADGGRPEIDAAIADLPVGVE